jgi:hypothetical protein
MKRHKKPQIPNLAICGWVRMPPRESRFDDLFQRGGWCFARNQKGLGKCYPAIPDVDLSFSR